MDHPDAQVLEDGVAHVVLRRAPDDAVDRAMYGEIADLFERIDRLGGVRRSC